MVVPTIPKTSEEVTGNLELLFEKNIQLSQEFFGQFEEHKILMVLPCALFSTCCLRFLRRKGTCLFKNDRTEIPQLSIV